MLVLLQYLISFWREGQFSIIITIKKKVPGRDHRGARAHLVFCLTAEGITMKEVERGLTVGIITEFQTAKVTNRKQAFRSLSILTFLQV